MSGRIRTIKPELLDDEPTAALSDAAWRIYMSLHLCADDFGNARLGNNYVAAMVWQDTMRDPSEPLAELVAKRFVIPFAKSEQRYGHIRGWDKHQRIDNRGKGRVPAMSDDDGSLPMWFRGFRARFAESPEAASPVRGEPGPSLPSSPLARARTHRAPAQSGGGTTTTTTTTDPEEPEAGVVSKTETSKASAVNEIHEHYLDAKQRHNSKTRRTTIDAKERKAVQARLDAGHTVEDLKSACDGLFLSDHHVKGKYLSIGYAMKPENVEKFIALADVEPEVELPIIRHPDRDRYIPKPGQAVSTAAVLSLFGVGK